MKKKNVLKTVSGIGLFAGGCGLSMLSTKLLGKLFEKRELTDEYVERHPWLAFIRIVIRIFMVIAAAVGLMWAPIQFLLEPVCNFIDKKFPDEEENK